MSWSSQRYIEKGLADGRDPKLVKAAASEIERLVYGNPAVPAVLTLAHLADRCGVDYLKLRSIVARNENHYAYFRIRKRSGGHRLISVPEAELRRVQKWIHTHILSKAKAHPACFSFLRKISIRDCAAQHRGAKWVIKVDISAFFGSVSERHAFDVFVKLGYRSLIAFEMARIVTDAPRSSKRYLAAPWKRDLGTYTIAQYTDSRVGFLPQGAPSSPLLSNLFMMDVDPKLEALAVQHGLRYSRYSDDMTFSTRGEYSRERAKKLVHAVAAVIRAKGLRVNTAKTRIIPPGGRRMVLGLLVDGSEPRLSRKFRDTLRMHIYHMKNHGVQYHAERRGFDSVSGLYRHVKGLLDYAKSIDLSYWGKMSSAFAEIVWPNPWPDAERV
ncbi:reverse transcriptase family protein [Mesorhizobium sp. M0601]|uniref:reverse transcriptase family protein n=1 Tax=Mesorhizobium sp. M0601 TaxID=2956969 RepID=UPI00333D341D